MKYDYDAIAIVIGLDASGMAVSIMGAEMGLRACAGSCSVKLPDEVTRR